MTLTKKKMVSEIARRTRLTNAEAQLMLEALLEIWMEELVSGGRIELENLFVLDTHEKNNRQRRLTLRASKRLRQLVNE